MERPYKDLTGEDIRALIDGFWGEFEYLGEVAYELQFRDLIASSRKAAVIERLIELGRGGQTTPDFEFPSTDVVATRQNARMGLGSVSWRDVGLLKLSGYGVGKTAGLPDRQRRGILNFLFLRDTLADVDDPVYASEWGAPMTSARLQKLSESIAAFARNAKRNPNNLEQAISDWEKDLEYLRDTFYEGWGDFPWPDVRV